MAVNGETSAEIQIPGGWRAKLSGVSAEHIIIIALVIVCSGMVLWNQYELNHERREDTRRFLAQHQVTQGLLKTVIENQTLIVQGGVRNAERLQQQNEAVIYVLTLSDRERQALKLSMPEALRKQMNTR